MKVLIKFTLSILLGFILLYGLAWMGIVFWLRWNCGSLCS